MELVRQKLQDNQGIIVYYNWVKGKTMPTQQEITQMLPLKARVQADQGIVFTIQPGED
jgi:hypothetical protein